MKGLSRVILGSVITMLVIINMVFDKNNSEAMAVLFAFLSADSVEQYKESKNKFLIVSAIICLMAAMISVLSHLNAI